MAKSGLTAFLVTELKELVPPTLFFAVGFNLIVLTIDLILADYVRTFANFLVATTTALVVGKSVLVADAMSFLRRFDSSPLIQPVLFKTSVYWAVVFVVRFLEKLVEYFFGFEDRRDPGTRYDVVARRWARSADRNSGGARRGRNSLRQNPSSFTPERHSTLTPEPSA
ncbi:MAG: hypothetical protein JOZ08_05510 [Verrucomicrobia bacterium]|nr:hypothetical protein [Verrucomicrobiota bacterium]MBV8278603.1 hypothetical protein [Verrucomicrobiota bacterium]